MPQLVQPHLRWHASCLAAMVEDPHTFADWGAPPESSLHTPGAFAVWLATLRADAENPAPRPPNHVPQTVLWWVEGDELLARVGIRHRLNQRLRIYGGHIGYWVRPSARRQGHAGAAFRAALEVAGRLGIDPALLTCDHDNLPSRRVIEGAGGVFEQRLREKRLYWVPTRPWASSADSATAGSGDAPV